MPNSRLMKRASVPPQIASIHGVNWPFLNIRITSKPLIVYLLYQRTHCRMTRAWKRRSLKAFIPDFRGQIVGCANLPPPSRPPMQHGVIAGDCFPAASSLTGLGLALAKESSHGAVCWSGRIAEGDEPLRGGANGHDPLARQVCVDTGEHCRCPRQESTGSDPDRP